MSELTAVSLGPVEVRCEYTLEDFREGLSQQVRKKRPRPPWLTQLINTGWFLFFIGLLLFLAWEGLTNANGDVKSYALPPVAGWSVLLVSTAGAFLTTSILFIVILMPRVRKSKKRFVRYYVKALSLLIFALVLGTYVVVPLLIRKPPAFVRGPISSDSLTMLCVVPWAICFAFLVAILAVFQKRKIKRSFREQSDFAQAVTFTFDDGGVIVRRTHTTTTCQWAFFIRTWETYHLFVLEDKRKQRHIIPKRFICTLWADARFRALLFNNIADTKFLSEQRGFAVAPVPAIPIDNSSSTRAKGLASE